MKEDKQQENWGVLTELMVVKDAGKYKREKKEKDKREESCIYVFKEKEPAKRREENQRRYR